MTKITKVRNRNFTINIIMYHYVREIQKSKYPNLKGLEFNDFKKQINGWENLKPSGSAL